MAIELPVIQNSSFEDERVALAVDDLSGPGAFVAAEPQDYSHLERVLGADRQGVIRQSSIETLSRCAREFMFRYRFGLVPNGATGPGALSIGTFYHKLMEFYYQGLPEELALSWGATHIEETIAKILGDSDDLSLGMSESQLRDGMQKDLALARVAAQCFIRKYPRPPNWEVVATEEEIVVTHEAFKVDIGGRLDLIIRDKTTGSYYVVDHKTSSLSPSQYALALPFAIQGRLYRLLAQTAHPDWKVAGVIHNVILKPTIRIGAEDRPRQPHVLQRGKNKGKIEMRPIEGSLPQFDLYLQRCIDWYEGTGDYEEESINRQLDPPILQSVVEYPSHAPLVDRELAATLLRASRACRAETVGYKFPRNSASCIRYKRMCSYMPLCRAAIGEYADIAAKRYSREKDLKDESDLE